MHSFSPPGNPPLPAGFCSTCLLGNTEDHLALLTYVKVFKYWLRRGMLAIDGVGYDQLPTSLRTVTVRNADGVLVGSNTFDVLSSPRYNLIDRNWLQASVPGRIQQSERKTIGRMVAVSPHVARLADLRARAIAALGPNATAEDVADWVEANRGALPPAADLSVPRGRPRVYNFPKYFPSLDEDTGFWRFDYTSPEGHLTTLYEDESADPEKLAPVVESWSNPHPMPGAQHIINVYIDRMWIF